MERRKFTREFKLEAVRLIKDRGVSYVQASQDLNVHPSQLRDLGEEVVRGPAACFPWPRPDEALHERAVPAAVGRQRRRLFDEPIR